MAQTSRLVLEIDSRDAEQKAADTRKALEALENAGLRVKPALDKAGDGMEGAGKSADKAGKSFASYRDEVEDLLGRIDPLSRKLGELDKQEQELARHRKAGTIDLDTFTDYQAKITSTREALTRFNTDMNKTGISAKQTAAALRGVPAQFTDIAVSLQGGQAPLTVLLQQGGQLKDMFGGVGPAAKALGGYIAGLVTPLTLAGAAVAALGVAYYQGSQEQEEFSKAILLTGNFAGTSTAKLADMAKQIAASGGTVGAAADALAQIAASGEIAGGSFRIVAETAVAMQKATGQSVAQTIADFKKISDDPVRAAEQLNDKYHFLTQAVYDQAKALVEQGNKQEAVRLITEKYGGTMVERSKQIKSELGTLPTIFSEVGKAASGMWDQIMGIGREKSSSEMIDRLKLRIQSMENIPVQFRAQGGFDQKQLDAWKAQLATLQKQSAPNPLVITSAQTEAQKKWDDLVSKNLSDQAKLAKDIADARALGVAAGKSQAEIDKEVADIQAKYDKAQPKTKAYTEDAGTKELDKTKQQYAVLLQQNALIGAQGDGTQKLGAAQQDLIRWEQQLADIKGKQTLTADQKSLLAKADQITAAKKQSAEQEKLNSLKQIELDQSAKLLAFQENLNSQLNLAQSGLREKLAGAGLGDKSLQRLQEQQQIQQSYQQQMDRLTYDYNKSDKSSSTTDLYNKETASLQSALQQRLAMQKDYYTAVDQQQSDWSLGASAAFQNYRDQAADMAGQTKTLFTNAFTGMEDVFVNFVKTGKISFSSLADSIISDMARMAARQASSSLLTSLFGVGSSLFAGSTGANGFAAGSAAATSSSLGASAAGYSSLYGFSDGGYTGSGGKYEPKGVVHGGEFVVQKSVVSQPGVRDFLERMNNSSNGYADGGYVVPTGAVASSNASGSTASSSSMPTVQNVYHISGSADDRTIQQIKAATQQATTDAIKYVAKDFASNGPLRQSLAKR